jgi:hypothetical protein
MHRPFPTFAHNPTEPITLDFERLHLLMLHQPFAESQPHDWEAACYQYRCFLGLKQRYPSLLLVPPPAALQLWHIHILDTRAYRSDCERLLQRFLDYLPGLGLYGLADHQQLRAAREACSTLLLHHYGPDSLRA